MSEVKNIKNEQWSVEYIFEKIENGEIIKDKYQRPKKWLILQDIKDTKKPSIEKFIEFLYITLNSVHVITFGKKNNQYANIDGNNRLNAIIFYLKNPFEVFPKYFEELEAFIKNTFIIKDNEFTIKDQEDIINIFKSLSYNEIMDFKYQTFFAKKNKKDLYNNYLKLYRDQWESFFYGVDEENIHGFQSKFKIGNKINFNNVKININIFEGYSDEELNDIYVQVNTYNSTFTEIELLAGRLCNVTNFTIHNNVFKSEINQVLSDFYEKRSNDEALKCYQFTDSSIMNAYDFIVGFQIYAHNKCVMIQNVDNIGLSLFFKVWRLLYKSTNSETFTTENVNNFIDKIEQAINIFKEVDNDLFPKQCNKIFKNKSKKETALGRNNLYIIIISIIGFIERNIDKKKIIKSIEKCILYHYFVNDIVNKEDKEIYNKHDSIAYTAGGAFIDNQAEDIYNNPSKISDNITKEIFNKVLSILIEESIKNIPNKKNKRKNRLYHEIVLLINYFKCKMPVQYLNNDNEYWIEHIIPFSSSWSDQIDIDRLGNIIPILDNLNRERGNKHINIYSDIDFIKYLNDIIPFNNKYDTIVNHTDRKPKIINNNNYNTLCYENENKLKKELITYLFS